MVALVRAQSGTGRDPGFVRPFERRPSDAIVALGDAGRSPAMTTRMGSARIKRRQRSRERRATPRDSTRSSEQFNASLLKAKYKKEKHGMALRTVK